MNESLDEKDIKNTKKQANLRLLFSMMELAGKSDREIAKHLGINNSTLSRGRKRLEQGGFIREYTLIPNFWKVGLEVIVFTFSSTVDVFTPTQSKELRELLNKYPQVLSYLEDRGATGTNWVFISTHKTFEDYAELSNKVMEELSSHRSLEPMPHVEIRNFMFLTNRVFPKSFSLKNLQSIFQPIKPSHFVENKDVEKQGSLKK